MITKEQARNLEKIDLHRHADGDVKPEIIYELGRYIPNFPYKSLNHVKAASVVDESDDFLSILGKFAPAISVMQSKENIERVFYEEVRNCSEDNIVKAELRFAPLYHMKKGLSIDDILGSAVNGMKSGAKEFGVKSGIIVCINRECSSEESVNLVKEVIKHDNSGVVGIDLACDETNHAPLKHFEAFNIAYSNGLNRTVHAGETGLRKDDNIKDSILELKANRLGHAVTLCNNPELISLVNDCEVGVESCPLSNIRISHATGVNNISQLGLKKLLDSGVKISLNTDDPRLLGFTLTDVYFNAAKELNLLIEDLQKFIHNAEESSFIK